MHVTHVGQLIPSLAYITQGLVGTRLINQLTGKAEGTHQLNIEAPYNHSVQHH